MAAWIAELLKRLIMQPASTRLWIVSKTGLHVSRYWQLGIGLCMAAGSIVRRNE